MKEFIFCKSLLINYVIRRFSWQDTRPIYLIITQNVNTNKTTYLSSTIILFIFIFLVKKVWSLIYKLKRMCPFWGKTWNGKIQNSFHQLGNVLDSLKYFKHSICRILIFQIFQICFQNLDYNSDFTSKFVI